MGRNSLVLKALKEAVDEVEEVDMEFAKVMKTIQNSTGVKGKKLFMPVRLL